MCAVETLPPGIKELRALDSMAPARLALISEAQARRRPKVDKWCAKEELGHLCDSACINHQRIVLTLLSDAPSLGAYDPPLLVQRHNYREQDWADLILLWQGLIMHLLMIADTLTPADWRRTCTLEGLGTVTLGELITHFVSHQCHHLCHIGIRMDDLSALCE
jgi:hypothetical protein